ncbi:hypothetical protein EDB85DRAFT_1899542 [Lactarius pseudohatsudake]|nr:hypothetical protein EDB85DRAFT_1899542 [Lactarius pseudohatsudake]
MWESFPRSPPSLDLLHFLVPPAALLFSHNGLRTLPSCMKALEWEKKHMALPLPQHRRGTTTIIRCTETAPLPRPLPTTASTIPMLSNIVSPNHVTGQLQILHTHTPITTQPQQARAPMQSTSRRCDDVKAIAARLYQTTLRLQWPRRRQRHHDVDDGRTTRHDPGGGGSETVQRRQRDGTATTTTNVRSGHGDWHTFSVYGFHAGAGTGAGR